MIEKYIKTKTDDLYFQVPIYKSPSIESDKIGFVLGGEKIEFKKENSFIKLENSRGYIKNDSDMFELIDEDNGDLDRYINDIETEKLINTEIEFDKNRKKYKNSLENSCSNWTSKQFYQIYSLFLDGKKFDDIVIEIKRTKKSFRYAINKSTNIFLKNNDLCKEEICVVKAFKHLYENDMKLLKYYYYFLFKIDDDQITKFRGIFKYKSSYEFDKVYDDLGSNTFKESFEKKHWEETIINTLVKIKDYFEKQDFCCSNKKQFSNDSIDWIHLIEKQENIKIRTALHENGEYVIKKTKFKSDGFCEENNTIYDYLGCYFHGHLKCFGNKKYNYSYKTEKKKIY